MLVRAGGDAVRSLGRRSDRSERRRECFHPARHEAHLLEPSRRALPLFACDELANLPLDRTHPRAQRAHTRVAARSLREVRFGTFMRRAACGMLSGISLERISHSPRSCTPARWRGPSSAAARPSPLARRASSLRPPASASQSHLRSATLSGHCRANLLPRTGRTIPSPRRRRNTPRPPPAASQSSPYAGYQTHRASAFAAPLARNRGFVAAVRISAGSESRKRVSPSPRERSLLQASPL